jgi:5-methylcytosine-specific restriction endonuclease McrA
MASEKNSAKLDQIVAQASRERLARDNAYRERALKMYPWVCGRCAREFNRENLRELTVHHRDHNHDNNPLDGSNWELLCVYCHDNEHSRLVDPGGAGTDAADEAGNVATYNPFANLALMLKEKK